MKRLAICLGLALLTVGPLGTSSAARLPLAGSLDPSFGSDGVAQGPAGGINAIAIQPDGKIVVAGKSVLARYLPDGALDSSFGAGGEIAPGFEAEAVALQPDGKIVVGGSSGPVSDLVLSEFTLARYDANGALDASFGTGGITKTVIPEPTASYCAFNCGWNAGAKALAILPSGDVVAAGTVWGGPDPAPPDAPGWSSFFALARYAPDGSLDQTFGDAGVVQTAFSRDGGLAATLSGIVVQPDGRIVATGSAGYGGHGIEDSTIAIARYEPDGSLDSSFGIAGEATTDLRRLYNGGPPTLQGGKILVAGSAYRRKASDYVPVLVRFDAGGLLDPLFGHDGIATIGARDIGTPTAILAQTDRKVMVAEYSYQQRRSTLVRLLPNGRLDTSFGRGGVVPFDDEVSSLALQTDRKILVGGLQANAESIARLIGGNNCVVPNLAGKPAAKADAALRKAYCRRGSISARVSNKVGRGRVISTAPIRGTRLPGGTRIHLVLSRGKPR